MKAVRVLLLSGIVPAVAAAQGACQVTVPRGSYLVGDAVIVGVSVPPTASFKLPAFRPDHRVLAFDVTGPSGHFLERAQGVACATRTAGPFSTTVVALGEEFPLSEPGRYCVTAHVCPHGEPDACLHSGSSCFDMVAPTRADDVAASRRVLDPWGRARGAGQLGILDDFPDSEIARSAHLAYWLEEPGPRVRYLMLNRLVRPGVPKDVQALALMGAAEAHLERGEIGDARSALDRVPPGLAIVSSRRAALSSELVRAAAVSRQEAPP